MVSEQTEEHACENPNEMSTKVDYDTADARVDETKFLEAEDENIGEEEVANETLVKELQVTKHRAEALEEALKQAQDELSHLIANKDQDDALASSVIDQYGADLEKANAAIKEQAETLKSNKVTIDSLEEGLAMKEEYINSVLNQSEKYSWFEHVEKKHRDVQALLESERKNSNLTVEDMQREIDEALDKVQSLEQKSLEMCTKNEELEAMLESERERGELQAKFETDLNETKSSLKEAQREIKELSAVVSQLEKEKSDLAKEREGVESEKAKAQAKVELLEVAVQVERDEIKRLNSFFEENIESLKAKARSEVEFLEVAVKTERNEIKRLNKVFEESIESVKSTARTEVEFLEVAVKVEREENKRKNELIEKIKSEKADLVAELENESQKVLDLQEAIKSKDSFGKELKASLDKCKKAQVELAVKAVKLEDMRQHTLKELKTTNDKLDAAKWDIVVLDEKLKAATKANEAHQESMAKVSEWVSALASNVKKELQQQGDEDVTCNKAPSPKHHEDAEQDPLKDYEAGLADEDLLGDKRDDEDMDNQEAESRQNENSNELSTGGEADPTSKATVKSPRSSTANADMSPELEPTN